MMVLAIKDNGKGIDLDSELEAVRDPGKKWGLGRHIMGYRAGAIGATLRVRTLFDSKIPVYGIKYLCAGVRTEKAEKSREKYKFHVCEN
jgi:hypothetical protein